MGAPLVSVLMPAFNCEKYVGQAIEAVLGQSFSDFEFIIVDDGSTDNTRQVINAYEDPRIRICFNEENLGIVAALNNGLELVNGKYIIRTDSDDQASPGMIEHLVSFMESNSEYIVCGGQMKGIINGKLFKYPIDDEDLKVYTLNSCPFSHSTVAIRTHILKERNLRYDSSFLDAEDYALWSFLIPFGKFHNLDRITLLYRESDSQITANHKYQINRSNALKKIFRLHAVTYFKLQHEDIETYVCFMEGTTPSNYQDLRRNGEMVSRLLKTNDRLSLFDNSKLEHLLFVKWYSYCLRFKGSPIKVIYCFLLQSIKGRYFLRAPYVLKLAFKKFI